MFLGLMRWCLMISQLQHSFAFLSFLSFFFFFLSVHFLHSFLASLLLLLGLRSTLLTTIAYLCLIASCFLLYIMF